MEKQKFRKMCLSLYLRAHELLHRRALSHLAYPLFGGLHPRNVFHYRSDFFLESLEPHERVLDIACGTGRILHSLAGKIALGVGIESSKASLIFCKKNAPSNLEFIESDLFFVDYAKLAQEKNLSTAIFSHILEHIEKPVELLKKVSLPRVLVCVPSEENWQSQLLKHLNLDWKKDPSHYREYSKESLKKELEAAGYTLHFLGYNSEGEIVADAKRV